MGSILPRSSLRADTDSRSYTLPPGAEIAVRVGDAIHAGDVIAHLPPLPRIIALTDSLHLSQDAGMAAIRALDGTAVEAGALLGKHRTGLRTHTLRAPCSGAVRGMPALGAVAILPNTERGPLRAAWPGIVATTEEDRLTITSRIFRCRLAFATGSSRAYGRLIVPADERGGRMAVRPDTPGLEVAITAISHIAEMADLTAALRGAPGPIIVGTVSATVAWEMLVRQPAGNDIKEHGVAVLLGPGDRGGGERAVRHLRTFDGALLDLDPSGGTLTIYPERMAGGDSASAMENQTSRAAISVTPARWHLPCMVTGEPALGLVETGARTMVVRRAQSGEGTEWIPVVNVVECPDS